MSERIKLALILGSTREGRFCDTVADWAAGEIEGRDEFLLDRIDPAHLDLPARLERRPGPAVQALRQRLGAAEAFVVVTPEYNRGYPAVLKQVIDSANAEWQAKPVAFVSYGGVAGGLRAVEQLRLVFAELHAMTVRDAVSFAGVWQKFTADGRLHDPEGPGRAMAVMLARLRWWALTLRHGRAAAPYGEAAG